MSTDPPTDLDGRRLRVQEAYLRVAHAYEAARLDVFDVYPGGAPPDHELTERQSRRLLELRLAERDMTTARKAAHTRTARDDMPRPPNCSSRGCR